MKKYTTTAMLTLVAVFWGGTFIAGKIAVQDFTPLVASFYRFAITSLLLVGYCIYRRIPIQVGKEDLIKLFFLGLTGIFIYNYFFFTGLQHASPSNGALVIAANPALTTLLAWLFLREAVTSRQIAGIIVSFLGVATVITRGDWEIIRSFGFERGELLFIVCMASWAVFSILGKIVMQNFSPLEAVTYASLIGTALFAAASWQEILRTPWSAVSCEGWGAIFYLAFFGTFIGFVWWYRGVKILGAARAAVFINLVPISAMVISTFWGDPINLYQMLGAALVTVGVYLTTRKARQPEPQKKDAAYEAQ